MHRRPRSMCAGSGSMAHGVGDLLVAAAQQEAHAAATAALCASVLLAYLAAHRGCAGWHLSAQQAAALQRDLLPRVPLHAPPPTLFPTQGSPCKCHLCRTPLASLQGVLEDVTERDRSLTDTSNRCDVDKPCKHVMRWLKGFSCVCMERRHCSVDGCVRGRRTRACAVQAEAVMLSAAVAYWATSTPLERPSAASAAAPADPASLIGKLQLVTPAGGGAPRLQVTALAVPGKRGILRDDMQRTLACSNHGHHQCSGYLH